MRLRGLSSDLIAPTIAVHHNRFVKRTGYCGIIDFRTVVMRVRLAIELLNAVIVRNAALPPERRIEFRAVGRGMGRTRELR